jgi:Ran GTPase-activating protein (RanGAP) involved in mRNA processing and transport
MLLVASPASLVHLDVSANILNGSFPAALYGCRSLQFLDLSDNHVGGELPGDIGHGLSTNLHTLNLSYNEFSGIIPASLSRLQRLWYLKLDNNCFTDTMVELDELTRALRYCGCRTTHSM